MRQSGARHGVPVGWVIDGHACDAVAELSDYYDVRLHERHGGELAYG